ncbi:MAG TPA: dihydrofolate reductase family protein [Chitinophaga sp.]|uniref:dihydrofolate reductase family protein n=1 Tax=Chitinophaga sp. TaxID=1869181 RepID=UPI002D16DF6C|nr:dihydrofolate reductase family protein [Chitinophaga sp.]HVI44187.1 dihydrofolate reductase family protein [Chitinophaga sp.]
MRKLIVSAWISLDGIFDAASMGQWFAPYDSPERQAYIAAGIMECDAILFGRDTYQMLAPYWSSLKNNEMGVADKLNNVQKYVVSTTLQEASWNNTAIIRENVVEEISRLKQQPGREIQIEGSATLIQSLTNAGLIDEYRLLVHPHMMGSGKRFFKDGTLPAGLELLKSEPMPKGVIALYYRKQA